MNKLTRKSFLASLLAAPLALLGIKSKLKKPPQPVNPNINPDWVDAPYEMSVIMNITDLKEGGTIKRYASVNGVFKEIKQLT